MFWTGEVGAAERRCLEDVLNPIRRGTDDGSAERRDGGSVRRVSRVKSVGSKDSLVDVLDRRTSSTMSLTDRIGFPSFVEGDGDKKREGLERDRRSAKGEVRKL